MKLHKLTCPNCNGSLDIKIKEGTSSVFCPYCGQKFYVDDEKREYTINKNIKIDKNVNVYTTNQSRYTDDARVIKAKLEEKENKRTWIAILLLFLVGLGIPFGILAKFEIDEKVAKREGKISAGYYRDLVGENYRMVEAHFRAAGFTDIELIDLDDVGVDFWNEEDVAIISVGGDTDFESTDWFDPDTKVIISYH